MGRQKKKKKSAVTADTTNRAAILIRPPALLGVANIILDPDVFGLVGYELTVVVVSRCMVPRS